VHRREVILSSDTKKSKTTPQTEKLMAFKMGYFVLDLFKPDSNYA
jgi:hypothetical protein